MKLRPLIGEIARYCSPSGSHFYVLRAGETGGNKRSYKLLPSEKALIPGTVLFSVHHVSKLLYTRQ